MGVPLPPLNPPLNQTQARVQTFVQEVRDFRQVTLIDNVQSEILHQLIADYALCRVGVCLKSPPPFSHFRASNSIL